MENDIPLNNNIISSILPILRKYGVEMCLIALAGGITLISFIQTDSGSVPPLEAAVQTPKIQPVVTTAPTQTLQVDVSGAVYHPGVYEATVGARIGELIEMAGGISYEADQYFVARNFNMARFVGDQDKIYIPYMFDIALGTFTERRRILEYLQPLGSDSLSSNPLITPTNQSPKGVTISINEASAEELDTLPGIGSVTAQKIIENRPYIALEDLLNKKVMNQSTFDKIKSHIEL